MNYSLACRTLTLHITTLEKLWQTLCMVSWLCSNTSVGLSCVAWGVKCPLLKCMAPVQLATVGHVLSCVCFNARLCYAAWGI